MEVKSLFWRGEGETLTLIIKCFTSLTIIRLFVKASVFSIIIRLSRNEKSKKWKYLVLWSLNVRWLSFSGEIIDLNGSENKGVYIFIYNVKWITYFYIIGDLSKLHFIKKFK